MLYGMNLFLWTGDLSDELLPLLERLKKMGYDGVELPVMNLDVKKFQAWGRRLDDLGLRRTGCTVRLAADNPISPDAAVRSAGVANNKLALDCCAAAGVETMIGPYHSALGEFSGKGPTADEWRWGVDSMRQVAEHAAKVGVKLAVEYLNRFETYLLNCAADTVRFVQEVNHPSCRMMYDTFHANIEEKSVAGAIRTCKDHVIHVHISENDRSTPGQGGIGWDETFDTLCQVGYDGWLVVEAFGLALPEIAAATKIWRRMYQDEEQLAREALAFMKRHVEARRK
jgi:D-psicose/D-tagatose/L-ribulose 3-epimerase